ncbi:hypothetical protein [Pseudoalteromonas luteoviolacea]|uniref:Uncharacterized protein n=1 Tax=Pseudoalteromonas luteoviolacea DSM 6061 TaxID=1365250 RepID=A0A166VTG8_9GAMM|nr:hypothetical protein [Pseudoalteromonas luteoviolacea]KZN33685.1 hypothetical protein N475_20135 [Pseudoalteromonas luteoviolacea DSM 6061]KZN53777.1 hypothetical protein N474_19595 [Pseudoalteromonas luteoviolacea CPMOR-2]MBE0389599.1 hypothetical protein [Pseudoalteromonas luteoviolacea DSM 6061]
MSVVYRILIALVLLVCAISAYSFGNSAGLFGFIILGFLFEAAFWLKLFGRKKTTNKA